MKDQTELIFETAQIALSGILSGPLFTTSLVNVMSKGERITVGAIITAEAWDMAENLVNKYLAEKARNAPTD